MCGWDQNEGRGVWSNLCWTVMFLERPHVLKRHITAAAVPLQDGWSLWSFKGKTVQIIGLDMSTESDSKLKRTHTSTLISHTNKWLSYKNMIHCSTLQAMHSTCVFSYAADSTHCCCRALLGFTWGLIRANLSKLTEEPLKSWQMTVSDPAVQDSAVNYGPL